MPEENKSPYSGDELAELWGEKFGDHPHLASLRFKTSIVGRGAEIDVELAHDDVEELKRAAQDVRAFLTSYKGVKSTWDTFKQGKKEVSFAAPYPGSIIPLDLKTVNGDILCQKDAFLCAAKGTEVTIAFTRKLGTGFFGGEGFILQRLKGNGMAFLHAGGTVVKKELRNESILIDTGCIVAFTQGLDYNIERVGGLKSMFFGGEGLFLATLEGTGTVYMQSLPFSRLADRIIKHAPRAGGSSKGEGSVLGGLGRLIDGDR